MKTFTAFQSVGGAELLAALVTSEGLQPELDDQTSARFLTFAVKGEGQVHAVALGSEVELQELDAKLDAKLEGSDLDQCKLLFESISRLKVLKVPEQTTPHSVVRSSLKKFLDEETVETETRRQIWVDAFGKCQSETEHTGNDRHTGVAEETGDDELQVFTRKLKRKELEHLLPKVPEEWWEGMQRSAVSSWTEWLNLDAVRDGFKRCPSQTKLALAGGALLGVVGCYLNFLPAGVGGASSRRAPMVLEELVPCVNATNLKGVRCVDGVPLCVTHAENPKRGCVPFGAAFDRSTLERLTSSGMYNICRTSNSCAVADTKASKNITLTIGKMKDARWCADELHQDEALCVDGVGLCVLDTGDPEKKCYQRRSLLEDGRVLEYLSKLVPPGNGVDVCRVRSGCPIPSCTDETNLKHTTCVKGVPYCLTNKRDAGKRCFLMGAKLRPSHIFWLSRQLESPFDVCRASGTCGDGSPVVCDVPWPMLLTRVEAPMDACDGVDLGNSREPAHIPETCAVPLGGAFACVHWDPIASRHREKCFSYGDSVGVSFKKVRHELQKLRPGLVRCSLNHPCKT
ncbi:putative transmembrane protein [Gregarina niphandrodes]|uniref:Transmembrane protein n=1 Tax=Gregarina niphandrodes TaxID=110365 RepID=A0A023AZS2_GRENI|nr:putative transmembrane protein [Gregarina niphandrodes]EZG44419.1 putative transmembrane protein [Gregarina niphandrodes]|eukprot:XP_011134181.1 putative transmembrane protein [Gregarina niphandrodes]